MPQIFEKGTILSVTREFALPLEVTDDQVTEFLEWQAGRTRSIDADNPLVAHAMRSVTDRAVIWKVAGNMAERPAALARPTDEDDEFDPRYVTGSPSS